MQLMLSQQAAFIEEQRATYERHMSQLDAELKRQCISLPYIAQLQSLNSSLEQAMVRVVELEANASSRIQQVAQREAHNVRAQSQVCAIS